MDIVYQRELKDCGIAALAMAMGISYEVSLQLCRSVRRNCVHAGLYIKDLELAAKRGGRKTFRFSKTAKSWPLELRGVISMRRGPGLWHFAAYQDGMIFDPYLGVSGTLKDWRQGGWRLGTMLQVLP